MTISVKPGAAPGFAASVWCIAKREWSSFFGTPMGYVVLAAWLFFQGATFAILVAHFANQPISSGAAGDNPLSIFYGNNTLFYIALLIFVPLLTMRLVAEERKQGTLESALTAPITENAFVLGKFLSSMGLWCSLWIPTLIYVWIASRFGSIDGGKLGATFIGIFGVGLYYMSIGLLMSTFARSPIVAAVLTFAVIGVLFLFGLLHMLGFDESWNDVFEYMSVWKHLQVFSTGLIDTRYLVHDISLSAFLVWLATRVLAQRREP